MTYRTPKMKRVLIQFPPTVLEDVDRIASEMGLTRAELVRIAVGHWTVCDAGEYGLRRRLIERLLSVQA